jgi:hypothetical protein
MVALIVLTALVVTVGAPVPADLTTLERVAEEIDDAVANGEWAEAQDLETKGERALHSLRIERSAAKQRAVKALNEARAATHAHAALRTRLAANRLAGAVVDLYEPLRPNVPTSVMRLDVLLRTVDLAALGSQAAEARRALGKVNAIWKNLAVKPPLAGSDPQRIFNKQLARVKHALDAGDFTALHEAAVAALEGVDSLENRYEGSAQ